MSGDGSDPSVFSKLPHYLHMEQSQHMDQPIEVQVKGKLPKWISGSLFRNGAGLYKVGPTVWNHLFDGFAVLQRWTIKDGKVTYQSSVLDSEDYKKCAKRERLVGTGFGSSFPDPCETIFRRFFNRFIPTPPKPTENTNVNIVELGDRLFALTESPMINEVLPDSLSVKDTTNIKEYVAVHMGTAHPHKLKDGSIIYYGTNMNHKKAYNFISVPPQTDPSASPFSGAKILATVPSRWKFNISYTHSFGITENYFVHLEQPLAVSLARILFKKQMGINTADMIVPQPGESMDILLVNRATGQRLPITYRAPEGVVFHFINCYEDSGHVVCDICYHPKGAEAVNRVYFDLLYEDFESGKFMTMHFARFVLPLNLDEAEEGKNLVTLPNTTATALLEDGFKKVVCVTPENIAEEIPTDLPGINYAFNGTKYRYCYTSSTFSTVQRKLAKFDLEEKRVLTYDVDNDHKPGEPVFLARPGATEEDDGVVLSTIISCRPDVQSYLVVLDAKTFREVARASLPKEVTMTFTFHGMFTDKKL